MNTKLTLTIDKDVILSRNVKDYSRSELGVMTPERYLKIDFEERT